MTKHTSQEAVTKDSFAARDCKVLWLPDNSYPKDLFHLL